MRFLVAFALWSMAAGVAYAGEVEEACNAHTDFTAEECSCFALQADTLMDDVDQYYLAWSLTGPDGAQAALVDLAGDANAFITRYAEFSVQVDEICFPLVVEAAADPATGVESQGSVTIVPVQ